MHDHSYTSTYGNKPLTGARLRHEIQRARMEDARRDRMALEDAARSGAFPGDLVGKFLQAAKTALGRRPIPQIGSDAK